MSQWTLQSILIISIAFLAEQINLHGDEAHPLNGGLEYDLGDDLEISIRKMPDDPDGLDWSELQDVVAGLWDYIVSGVRYRTVTFDILDVEADVQIGWGHIVKWDRDSGSNSTTKRALQISTPELPSSANTISGQRNSSLADILGAPFDWPVEDSDILLRFSPGGSGHPRVQALDPEAVTNLFAIVIEIIQNNIAVKGQDALVSEGTFRYGRLVMLEVIHSPDTLTWEQLATVVLGLIDFMVDHNHYQSWCFTIFVGDPKVELGFGKVAKGFGEQMNVTVA